MLTSIMIKKKLYTQISRGKNKVYLFNLGQDQKIKSSNSIAILVLTLLSNLSFS